MSTKKHTKISFKDRIKKWRVGDYLRQFSIVTAGVMVTFIGSNIITSMSMQKEIKSTMQLIVKELEQNKQELHLMKQKYELDRIMASYLIDSSFVIEKFHRDTLVKYNRLVSQLSSFSYSTDALEVLKSSSMMQNIEDKQVVLSLIGAYKSLNEVDESLNAYYDLKKSIILPVMLEKEITDMTSLTQKWKFIFEYSSMRSFCFMANSFFNQGYLDDELNNMDRVINNLNELYQ